jgi:hypothetical protein
MFLIYRLLLYSVILECNYVEIRVYLHCESHMFHLEIDMSKQVV